MMTPYFSYFKYTLKENLSYRIEWILGLLDTLIQIFISIAVWKALYARENLVAGVDFSIIVTNFIISLGLSNIFNTNDFSIQRKIKDGSIATDLLKPIDYRKILLAQTLGEIFFKLLINFLPSLIITASIFGLLAPAGIINFVIYLFSLFLGFCLLWCLSLIIQMSAFWITNVWSLSTIKNVFVKVLSGAALPLYFMPAFAMKFIKYTPFDSIYHIPLQIYLGKISYQVVLLSMTKQLVWILILYGISIVMWHFGNKKITIQGG